jgi:hypothetical protein
LIEPKPECATCPIHKQRQTTLPGQKLRPQRKFTIHTELDIICEYCEHQPTPKSTLQLGKQYHCTQDTIQNILRRYNKPPRTFRLAQQTRRGSKPLTFPLTTEVPSLHTKPENQPYLRHLVAILLLTDGSAGYRQSGQPFITFTNKAQSLHALFADLIHHTYNQPPSAYYKPYWSKAKKQGSKAYYTTYFRHHDTNTILQDLHQLSPTFRTRPKLGQTWEEYVNEPPQPTIQFLIDPKIPQDVHRFAIRLAMSAEGTISPIFRNDSTKPYPHLVFACSHPLLRTEWDRYFKMNGLTLELCSRGIETAKISTSKGFLEMGGFFPGIQVRKGSYYVSLTRQQVLKAIFDVRKKENIESSLDITKKHTIVRRYAEKSADN